MKKKITESEGIPEFQESIDNMPQEDKDRVDKTLEERDKLIKEAKEEGYKYAHNYGAILRDRQIAALIYADGYLDGYTAALKTKTDEQTSDEATAPGGG